MNNVAQGLDNQQNQRNHDEALCRIEFDAYVGVASLPLVIDPNAEDPVLSDPLEWWKNHESQFPILASLARLYLAIQATSAPSERQFSVASRVINTKRSSLDPHTAGMQMFVSQNWGWYENHMANG